MKGNAIKDTGKLNYFVFPVNYFIYKNELTFLIFGLLFTFIAASNIHSHENLLKVFLEHFRLDLISLYKLCNSLCPEDFMTLLMQIVNKSEEYSSSTKDLDTF